MPETDQANEIVVLSETTVATLDGVRVGLSNVWEDRLEDVPGSGRSVLRATISVLSDDPAEDRDFRVAAGETIRFCGRCYKVLAIRPGEPLGAVRLLKCASRPGGTSE